MLVKTLPLAFKLIYLRITDLSCMAAYGLINLQGNGTINAQPLETPTLIRYGQLTFDEYFVTADAAARGVVITNTSATEPIVMLKHFAENPELKLD